ncbi:MAG: ErpK protein [Parasporobacterium sp.]|nr:ErpK protein [Parasporobacterium sp.]
MARRVISLDEKIKKAEAAVISSKQKYEAALDELQKLIAKRKQQDEKRLLEAFRACSKTADEIIAFIQSGEGLDEGESD